MADMDMSVRLTEDGERDDGESAEIAPDRRRELATSFDRLVDSNLALTGSVRTLVRTSWALLGFNSLIFVLMCVAVVIAIAGR